MMKRNLFVNTLVCVIIFLAFSVKGQISGNIYFDVNINGRKDKDSLREKGISGIRINAYNAQNVEIYTTLSNEDGSYYLEIPQFNRVKIVLSNVGSDLISTSPIIRFAESPSNNVDFGLMKMSSYVGDNPTFISSIFINGQPNKDSLEYQKPALILYKSDLEYISGKTKGNNEIQVLAKASEIGSVWGISYNPISKSIYSAAFLKRHSGLGSIGLDGIYQTDINTKITKQFLKLSSLGIDVGSNPHKDLVSKVYSASIDSATYLNVGKIGIGGIDWSENGKTLYVVNLKDKNLYGIDFSIKKDSILVNNQGYGIVENSHKYILPSEKNDGGEERPFGVKCFQDDVYVGVVIDAQKSQNNKDLRAIVYKLSVGKNEFIKVLDIPLDYQRGKALVSTSFDKWNPWSDDFNKILNLNSSGVIIYPQPIVSDIEFDNDGNMILALMDRFGHQVGTGQPSPDGTGSYIGIASGDILKTYKKKKNNFELENNGVVGKNRRSEGTNNKQGPSNGEFYYQEYFEAEGRVIHEENGSGAIAYNPETDEIMYAVHEPVNEEFNNSGIKWLDNKTGKSKKGYPFFKDSEAGTFSKVNAIGDIEMITDISPIICSNRVWMDCNENGIQEADEQPIKDVTIELWSGNQKITAIKSDVDGRFTFERLSPQTEYSIKVKLLIQKEGKNNEKLILTKANIGDPNLDNDASESDGFAIINFKTENNGKHIFNKDFGFYCLEKPIAQPEWTCKNIEDDKIEIALSIKDSKENERYLLTKDKVFSGISSYKAATAIHKNEVILNTILKGASQQEYTLRMINSSDCFRDFPLSISAQTCLNLLDDTRLGMQIMLYPNPASEKLNFTYKSNEESNNIAVAIIDIQGRVVAKTNISSKNGAFSELFDIHNFPNGTYIINVTDGIRKINKSFLKQ